jgi:hypothetical protein
MNDAKVLPIPAHKNYSALSAFRPENLPTGRARDNTCTES